MGERRELVFAAREVVGVDRRAREATVSDRKVFNNIDKFFLELAKGCSPRTDKTNIVSSSHRSST